jgi:hypothetical protein
MGTSGNRRGPGTPDGPRLQPTKGRGVVCEEGRLLDLDPVGAEKQLANVRSARIRSTTLLWAVKLGPGRCAQQIRAGRGVLPVELANPAVEQHALPWPLSSTSITVQRLRVRLDNGTKPPPMSRCSPRYRTGQRFVAESLARPFGHAFCTKGQ